MNPDRWQRISQLYHAALNYSADDRAAFLREACAGDDALQQDVESLLANESKTPDVLSQPAVGIAAQMVSDPGGSNLIGRQIGIYRLEALLGAGGMAEVYRARDTKLGRDVAIKILPHALTADRDRLARFEREARVLAALNHPNIATYSPRAAVDSRRPRHCPPDHRRARCGPREGHRPPRPQACEHQDHGRGRRQGTRLRSREAGSTRPFRAGGVVTVAHGDDRWHTRGRDRGHCGIYESGTGARHAGGQAHGYLGLRLCALRDADRASGVRRRDCFRHDRRHPRTRTGLDGAAYGDAATYSSSITAMPRKRSETTTARHR
jgi:hypothetical protein